MKIRQQQWASTESLKSRIINEILTVPVTPSEAGQTTCHILPLNLYLSGSYKAELGQKYLILYPFFSVLTKFIIDHC